MICCLQELLSANDCNDGKGSDVESDGEDWVPDPIDAVKTGHHSSSISVHMFHVMKDDFLLGKQILILTLI